MKLTEILYLTSSATGSILGTKNVGNVFLYNTPVCKSYITENIRQRSTQC